jgi:hypothetical protein
MVRFPKLFTPIFATSALVAVQVPLDQVPGERTVPESVLSDPAALSPLLS